MTVSYDGSLFTYSVPQLNFTTLGPRPWPWQRPGRTRLDPTSSKVFLVLCNRLAAVVFAVAMAHLTALLFRSRVLCSSVPAAGLEYLKLYLGVTRVSKSPVRQDTPWKTSFFYSGPETLSFQSKGGIESLEFESPATVVLVYFSWFSICWKLNPPSTPKCCTELCPHALRL